MYMYVLFACVSAHQKNAWDPMDYSYRWLLAAKWVLRIELSASEDEPMLLSPEPSIQAHFVNSFTV